LCAKWNAGSRWHPRLLLRGAALGDRCDVNPQSSHQLRVCIVGFVDFPTVQSRALPPWAEYEYTTSQARRPWPMQPGRVLFAETESRDLLLPFHSLPSRSSMNGVPVSSIIALLSSLSLPRLHFEQMALHPLASLHARASTYCPIRTKDFPSHALQHFLPRTSQFASSTIIQDAAS